MTNNDTIAILGNTKNSYSWFVRTFTEGSILNNKKVVHLDYRSLSLARIKTILMETRPRFVFTHLTFHKVPNKPVSTVLQLFSELKYLGILPIHVCYDARKIDRYNNDLSKSFHCALVGTKDMVRNGKRNWKIPVYYSTYSSMTYSSRGKYDAGLDFTIPLFTGSVNSHTDRKNFITEISRYQPIKIVETKSKEDLRDKTLDLSASTPCILGLCTGYDIDGYIDVRPFQYLGAGACMIMRKFKDMDKYIPDDLYYKFDTYSNPAEIRSLYMELMRKNPNTEMRRKAFRFIQDNHSSVIRLKQIYNVLEGRKQIIM